MLTNLLLYANNRYNEEVKCGKTESACPACIENGFYPANKGTYDCAKGIASYVMTYVPCYASSFYNFLDETMFFQRHFDQSHLKILSLGCGVCPDFYGIKKYIEDKQLSISLNYDGVDSSSYWKEYQEFAKQNNKVMNVFTEIQAMQNLDFSKYKDFDLIILDKSFSTIYNTETQNVFLENLKNFIMNDMKVGSCLIFKDANHKDCGRDFFDNQMSECFNNAEKYKFNINGAYGREYKTLYKINNVFYIPDGLSIPARPEVTKDFIFVYRKLS